MVLLITAHPDDESLFFAGLVLSQHKKEVYVVCVTDGNADGQGAMRSEQLSSACAKLGVSSWQQWSFPDRFETRLSQVELLAKLRTLKKPRAVYTHGPLGEYGHPHHQDVSFAVHQFYNKKCPVWSPSWNARSEQNIHLSPQDYLKKSKILTQIYATETKRLLNFLPNQSWEGFHRVDLKEVRHLYEYFTGKASLEKEKLKAYRHLFSYLAENQQLLKNRPF